MTAQPSVGVARLDEPLSSDDEEDQSVSDQPDEDGYETHSPPVPSPPYGETSNSDELLSRSPSPQLIRPRQSDAMAPPATMERPMGTPDAMSENIEEEEDESDQPPPTDAVTCCRSLWDETDLGKRKKDGDDEALEHFDTKSQQFSDMLTFADEPCMEAVCASSDVEAAEVDAGQKTLEVILSGLYLLRQNSSWHNRGIR